MYCLSLQGCTESQNESLSLLPAHTHTHTHRGNTIITITTIKTSKSVCSIVLNDTDCKISPKVAYNVSQSGSYKKPCLRQITATTSAKFIVSVLLWNAHTQDICQIILHVPQVKELNWTEQHILICSQCHTLASQPRFSAMTLLCLQSMYEVHRSPKINSLAARGGQTKLLGCIIQIVLKCYKVLHKTVLQWIFGSVFHSAA